MNWKNIGSASDINGLYQVIRKYWGTSLKTVDLQYIDGKRWDLYKDAVTYGDKPLADFRVVLKNKCFVFQESTNR